MNSFPLIADLLPHRGTMLWQDALLAYDDKQAVCRYVVPGDAWFLDAQQAMPAWLGIEVMAQAVAAQVACKALRAGRPPKRGALLGTRDFTSSLAAFPVGSVLITSATLEFMDDSGLGAYDCQISIDEQVVAQAKLKVYEPDDFEQFLASGSNSA